MFPAASSNPRTGPAHQIKAKIFQQQKGAKIRKLEINEVMNSGVFECRQGTPLKNISPGIGSQNRIDIFCARFSTFCG
jgi:hypothetical protein